MQTYSSEPLLLVILGELTAGFQWLLVSAKLLQPWPDWLWQKRRAGRCGSSPQVAKQEFGSYASSCQGTGRVL